MKQTYIGSQICGYQTGLGVRYWEEKEGGGRGGVCNLYWTVLGVFMGIRDRRSVLEEMRPITQKKTQ